MTPQQIEAMKMALDLATMHHTDDGYAALRAKVRSASKEALAQPKEEKLHPIHIGVDVTKEGTTVTAFYRKPDAVMEMFYSQFHPMAQQEQEPMISKWVLREVYFDEDGEPISHRSPPQRKPLTDEEADEFVRRFARYELIRAIEAAHGIKENT